MKNPRRTFLILTALCVVWGSFVPALAAPSGTKVSRVYQHPCSGPCDPADEVSENGVVHDSIEVVAFSSSSTGLNWMQLDILPPGADDKAGNWVCMRRWNSPSTNTKSFQWASTDALPDADDATDCASHALHGTALENGVATLRVRAKDISPDDVSSEPFRLKINNRPSRPVWAEAPSVSGDTSADPKVKLRWRANPESDVVEYHIVRRSPSGSEVEFAVRSSGSGDLGCNVSGNVYECTDDGFASSNYAGDYRYRLYAHRSTPASTSHAGVNPCWKSAGNCIESLASSEASAQLRNPPTPSAKPTPTKSTSGGGSGGGRTSATPTPRESESRVLPRRTSRPDYSHFYEGEYEEALPFGDQQGFEQRPGGDAPLAGGEQIATRRPFIPIERDQRPFQALAGGFLMLLGAGHLARLLRRSSRA